MEETVEITRKEFLELIAAFKTSVDFCEELNIYEHKELPNGGDFYWNNIFLTTRFSSTKTPYIGFVFS